MRFVAIGSIALAIIVGCSLDLDESLIGRTADAGASSLDGASPPNGADATADAGAMTPCTADETCRSADGCLQGTCDLSRKRCVYDVCRPKACGSAVCDRNAHTCGAPAPYKLQSTMFQLTAPIACARCAAAIHPWLFVATTAGLVVYDVSNPALATPRQVPVAGLGFVPAQIVASGNRIWLRGAAAGPGPSRMPIAWIDPPADPYATTMTAHTVLATYDRPAAEGVTLFDRSGDTALLAGAGPAQTPAATLDAPLAEPLSITSVATPLKASDTASAYGVSGKRLIVGNLATEALSFELVDEAGGPGQKVGGSLALTETVSTSQRMVEDTEGAAFWAGGVHAGVAPDNKTRALRGYFLVADATTPIAGDKALDIEVYDGALPVMPNEAVAGPIALVDPRTALVAARAKEDPTQTAIAVVTREPLGVKPASRVVLPQPIGAFAAATASHGIAYVIANIPGPPVVGTVYTFDPACDK